jgi:hypothetical protein
MKTIMNILEEINQICYEECDNVEQTGISLQGLGKIEKLLEDWGCELISECADQAEDDNTEHRILNLIDKL